MVLFIKSKRNRERESGAIATAYKQETVLAMHGNTVFDADLQNKRLQVSGLFGSGARQMRAVEHSAGANTASLPIQTLTLEVSNLSVLGGKKAPMPHEKHLLTKAAVCKGLLYLAHAVLFLTLLAFSRLSFAVLLHAGALTLAPAIALSLENETKRAAALLVHLAGVTSLLHQKPALDAELLSPAFYVLFVVLLITRMLKKGLSANAYVSRMCVVFYLLHAAALLAVIALFVVREAVARDARDQAALDLTATATAGIVLACHVLF